VPGTGVAHIGPDGVASAVTRQPVRLGRPGAPRKLGKGRFPLRCGRADPTPADTYDQDFLQRFTPCFAMDAPTLSEAIAACHVELILIHPFREGNGRLSRLLADVMAVQAGREPLDYSRWDADKPSYFTAIRCGMDRNY